PDRAVAPACLASLPAPPWQTARCRPAVAPCPREGSYREYGRRPRIAPAGANGATPGEWSPISALPRRAANKVHWHPDAAATGRTCRAPSLRCGVPAPPQRNPGPLRRLRRGAQTACEIAHRTTAKTASPARRCQYPTRPPGVGEAPVGSTAPGRAAALL